MKEFGDSDRKTACPLSSLRTRNCVCVLPGSFRGMGAFYFKTKIERIIINNGALNINITFNHLEMMQMSKQPE